MGKHITLYPHFPAMIEAIINTSRYLKVIWGNMFGLNGAYGNNNATTCVPPIAR